MSFESDNILSQLTHYRKPESTGDMPNGWELPDKEQKLIRAIQKENADARACARELIDNYGWGLAKIRRVLKNKTGVIP